MHETRDITELSNELTYHRYVLNQGQVRSLFHDMSIPEYIALHSISKSITENGDSDRAYLRDLAQELRLTIPQTSKMIGNLRDKGLVLWGHDGNGNAGTYITITESGLRLMRQQETLLRDYYSRVVEKFGRENMMTLLQLVEQLEQIMDAERNDGGDDRNDG